MISSDGETIQVGTDVIKLSNTIHNMLLGLSIVSCAQLMYNVPSFCYYQNEGVRTRVIAWFCLFSGLAMDADTSEQSEPIPLPNMNAPILKKVVVFACGWLF